MKAVKYLGMILVLWLSSQVPAQNSVDFADPELKAVVEARLGVSDPTPTDMLSLTALYGAQAGISDLSGLQHAVNLVELHLWENEISDISALSDLTKLVRLYLWSNQITDISPLAGLTNLRVLALPDNQITDITPLSGLTQLTQLYLYLNQIVDIGPLSGLANLEELYLYANAITDLTPLSGLTELSTLELGGNQITDVSSLSGLANLSALFLWENQLSDLSGLEELIQLQALYLQANQIGDISLLAGLNNLVTLHLWDNQISDIAALSGMSALQELALANNQIQDIWPLSEMTDLEMLYLYVNQISDITALAGLVQLTDLDVADNQISDVTVLSGLTKLVSLELGHNQISDISWLSGLVNLEALHLYGNPLSDISALADLSGLIYLNLEGSLVDDISPLAGLGNLTEIDLSGNQISDVSPLLGLANWEVLSLNGNPLGDNAYCKDLYEISGLVPYADYDPNPNPPVNVTAALGTQAHQIDIAWDAVCNGPVYSSYYQVYRAESMDGVKTALSHWRTEIGFVDDTVTPGLSYYYWVRVAADGQGRSGLSDYGIPALATVGHVDLQDAGEPYRGFAPLSLERGQEIEVYTRIENSGTDSSGPFKLDVYLSSDTLIDTSDYLLGQADVAAIDSGSVSDFLGRGTIAADTPLGDYYVGWIIDPDNRVAEINENNNSAYVEAYPLNVFAAPTPNPLTWAVEPNAFSANVIGMAATQASHVSGVEYFFDAMTEGGHDSDWQSSPIYIDSGLQPGTVVTYRVKARDLIQHTETGWSTVASATTDPAPDVTPPSPNPMTWALTPHATGQTTISMTATTATDVSGVEYFFDCTTEGGHDSTWQSSPTYVDSGLQPGTAYTYRVKARDLSQQNETDWSTVASATTDPAADVTPPSPNPMTWALTPHATGQTTISMTATTATDDSGVEYFFDCTTEGGHDSTWQASPIYVDSGLQPGTAYTYRVKARDLIQQNETGWSTVASATTDSGPDVTPPSPSPMTWAVEPNAFSANVIGMAATQASHVSGVEYFFDAMTEGGHDSDWQSSPIYIDSGLQPGTAYTYRVKARDLIQQNETDWSTVASATTDPAADVTPPLPNPMTWAVAPHATGQTSISMTATTATDASGSVQYYFDCLTPGGHDSTWQASPVYVDSGLQPGTGYTYRVKARDLSQQNETDWSTVASATTDPAADVTPPSPNPMTWAVAPHATGQTTISMTATTATDASGVEYFFDCTSLGGHDSTWQSSPVYVDSGLQPGTGYTYRVKARDLIQQNETDWSTVASATTDPAPDVTPPSPNPMTWAVTPHATGQTTISMTATTATDASGVEYFFDCTSLGGHDSTWQASPVYVDSGLQPGTAYTYRVKARDLSQQNETDWSTVASATTDPAPDVTPPSPNPMTWAVTPHATGQTTISMTATTATDVSGVEYFFDCTTEGGHDSTWQSSPVYVDSGLQPGSVYTYRVRARDLSQQNETDWSTVASATTDPAPDVTPPAPNPMTWALTPHATGPSTISMTATTATDISGVEYFFDCTSLGGHDSTWQASPVYVDSGLEPTTGYTYRVRARDLSRQNETDWSTLASATTHPAPDVTPPSPNPMTWALAPHATGQTSISMTATTATDASGGVQYYFDCLTPGGHDSAWQMSPRYEDKNLTPNTEYQYRVLARDAFGNQTDYSSPFTARTEALALGAAQNEDTGLWFDTIQQAIAAAETGHTIRVYPGTHTGSISFNGKVITLSSTNPSDWSVVEKTILHGNGAAGFIRLDSNGILAGLTITGCTDTSSWEGAICCTANRPTLRRCIIRDNHARSSAGVCTLGFGSAVIEDCRLLNNSAVTNGGALGGDFIITGCELNGNQAGVHGGAISACLAVSACSFTNNVAGGNGGALYSASSGLSIKDCTFSGNSAQAGGAIYADGPTTVNCIIQDNTALQAGGGLYTTHSPVLIGCAILGNAAQASHGGGIYHALNRLVLLNCTIRNCSAPFGHGGGIYSEHGLDIKNTILWGNRAASYDQLGGTDGRFYEHMNFHACAIEDGSTAFYIQDGEDFVIGLNRGGHFVTTDPLFMDTWHLRQDSPCRDQGQADPALPATDYDGDRRIMDMAVDIGADEIAPVTEVPLPNPMGWWAQAPQAEDSQSIAMTAAPATGSHGPIEYYFECQQDPSCSSDWQTERRYVARGLAPTTEYHFRVKARNRLGNETAFSEWRSATTRAFVDRDTLPPTPNPLTWAALPQATGLSTITMTATTAQDASGVEYFFDCTTEGGHDSTWQESPVYIDTGLQADSQHTYRVRARDLSANRNEGQWSVSASATTQAPLDLDSVDVRVISSRGDVEELPNGRMDFTSPDLSFAHNGSDQIVGVRFTGVEVPARAQIVNAYIEFRVGAPDAGPCSLVIRGQNTDNAPEFSVFAGLSSLATTSASVAWSPSPWTSIGAHQRTSNLSDIVQELVNRSGWTQGNDMAFVFTGSGRRVAQSYDGGGYLNGPVLHIDFE